MRRVHAVCVGVPPAPAMDVLDSAGWWAVSSWGFTAIVSDSPVEASRLAAEVRLLGLLHEQVGIVPMNIGATAGSESEISAWLRRERAALTREAARLALRVEMTARLPSDALSSLDKAGEGATPGLRHLKQLAKRRGLPADDPVRTLGPILDLCDAWRFVEPSRLAPKSRVALLVRRERVSAVREAFAGLRCTTAHAGCAVSLSGPWAPLTFASLGASASATSI